jgi:hypothetical protein
MPDLHQPFTNAQLEIIKAFSFNLKPEELIDFRETIARFFAERAIDSANKAWDENGWTNEKVDELLNKKLRSGK